MRSRSSPSPSTPGASPDDQLALILLCCHPALNNDAQVALTLRSVAGLSTDEIARGFVVDVATMAQRIVRAKNKIRTAGSRSVCPTVSASTSASTR